MRTGLITAGALILLAGCSIINNDQEALPGDPRSFNPGEAGVEQVLALLGPPARVSTMRSGFAFLYEDLDASETQAGLSFKAPVLNWFKLVYGWADVDRRTYLLVFDAHGALEESASDVELDDVLGDGFGFQFVFGVDPVVDSSYLYAGADPNESGFGLLADPWVGLNRASDVESGLSGIELRGTPDGAGQATLELGSRTDR